MNRWMVGGATLGCITMGSFALAGPGAAQSEPLQATIEPTTVVLGGAGPMPSTLTLSSIDPCLDAEGVPGTLSFDLFHEAIEEVVGHFEVDLTVEENPEGQWVVEPDSPDVPTGTYTYIVTCFPDDPEGEAIGEYVPLVFELVEPAPGPTEPPTPPTPPTAPPATPVPGTPRFTG